MLIAYIICAMCLTGAAYAKLVAQKSKGMPVISISLTKLVGTAGTEAIANLSLHLFEEFNSIHESYVEGCLLISMQQFVFVIYKPVFSFPFSNMCVGMFCVFSEFPFTKLEVKSRKGKVGVDKLFIDEMSTSKEIKCQ